MPWTSPPPAEAGVRHHDRMDISILISALALLISALSFIRAGQSSREERAIKMTQKKQEISTMVLKNILALRMAFDRLQAYKNEEGVEGLLLKIDSNISGLNETYESLVNLSIPDNAPGDLHIFLENFYGDVLKAQEFTNDIEQRVSHMPTVVNK